MARSIRATAIAALGVGLPSCMGIFDIVRPMKPLSGGYCLERFEGSSFLLNDCSPRVMRQEHMDLLDGSVLSIAWNDRYILARRSPHTSDKAAGWMVVDATERRIDGPLAPEELAERTRGDPVLASLRPRSPKDVWND